MITPRYTCDYLLFHPLNGFSIFNIEIGKDTFFNALIGEDIIEIMFLIMKSRLIEFDKL
jgi:hypothetical protein